MSAVRTAVFHPTGRAVSTDEAALLIGAGASVSLFGVELGAGTVVSAEPVEKFGRPGLWITMEATA